MANCTKVGVHISDGVHYITLAIQCGLIKLVNREIRKTSYIKYTLSHKLHMR